MQAAVQRRTMDESTDADASAHGDVHHDAATGAAAVVPRLGHRRRVHVGVHPHRQRMRQRQRVRECGYEGKTGPAGFGRASQHTVLRIVDDRARHVHRPERGDAQRRQTAALLVLVAQPLGQALDGLLRPFGGHLDALHDVGRPADGDSGHRGGATQLHPRQHRISRSSADGAAKRPEGNDSPRAREVTGGTDVSQELHGEQRAHRRGGGKARQLRPGQGDGGGGGGVNVQLRHDESGEATGQRGQTTVCMPSTGVGSTTSAGFSHCSAPTV
eukprot:ctg_1387.g444